MVPVEVYISFDAEGLNNIRPGWDEIPENFSMPFSYSCSSESGEVTGELIGKAAWDESQPTEKAPRMKWRLTVPVEMDQKTEISFKLVNYEINGYSFVYTNSTGEAGVTDGRASAVIYSNGSGYNGDGTNGHYFTNLYKILHTITYTDGVDGSELFPDQKYTVTVNSTTPAFDGTPTREGYTFTGWSPKVAETVTGNVTYTAQWSRNYVPDPSIPDTNPPTTDIPDENPPLANVDDRLNTTDHFAYVIGYPDGEVKPEQNITRAEAVTIFYRLMIDSYRTEHWSTTNSYPDADADAWYNCAISTATKAGIFEGDAEGTARPDDPITRAEFAALAARFISDKITDDGVGDFSDTKDHWAAKEIRLAAKAGWITGVGGGKFEPDRYINRAEVMTLVNRMLDRIPDKDHMLDDMIAWPDNLKSEWYYEAVQEATNGHDYERLEGSLTETWTQMQPVRDWEALEKEWSTAESGK